MNRGEIRDHIRLLADEPDEAPEGMFTNAQLNTLINLSQQRVALELFKHIPWAMQKKFTIGLTVNKGTYSIVTDLAVTDFFMMNGIFQNVSGQKKQELLFLEKDQIGFLFEVGQVDAEPKCWTFDDAGNIIFVPTPSTTIAGKYIAYYLPIFPDLNHDSTHAPNGTPVTYAVPWLNITSLKPAHELIAYEAVLKWHLADEEESVDIEKDRKRLFDDVVSTMTMPQGITSRHRPSIEKSIIGGR
jgi:hypothetical protein